MPTKVLFVDDDPLITDTLKRVLEKEQYYIICVTSGEEALAVLETEQIDVVVSDDRMPNMTGTELLRIIKERSPATIRIMLTGHPELDTAIRAINEDEVYRFMTKPVDAVDFAVTLRLAVERKQLAEQTMRLLQRYREKSHELELLKKEALEKEYPGITKVDVDSGGQFTIDEDIAAMDYKELIEEIGKELD
ncbi:MAG: response regulator [Kiritimatiellae bacterium]|nr:response regulator [Kiritimatiellia bacterium]